MGRIRIEHASPTPLPVPSVTPAPSVAALPGAVTVTALAASPAMIAVGHNCAGGDAYPPVQLYDAVTCAPAGRVGAWGTGVGAVTSVAAVGFSGDGGQVIVCDGGGRVCVYGLDGSFVRSVGGGVLGRGVCGAVCTVEGQWLVCEGGAGRVCVFGEDGVSLVREWACGGVCGVAVCEEHAYVLCRGGRLALFL